MSRRTVYYRIRDSRLHTIRTRCGSQRVLLESIEATEAGAFRHSITNHEYNFTVLVWKGYGVFPRCKNVVKAEWIACNRLENMALSTTARKAIGVARTSHELGRVELQVILEDDPVRHVLTDRQWDRLDLTREGLMRHNVVRVRWFLDPVGLHLRQQIDVRVAPRVDHPLGPDQRCAVRVGTRENGVQGNPRHAIGAGVGQAHGRRARVLVPEDDDLAAADRAPAGRSNTATAATRRDHA